MCGRFSLDADYRQIKSQFKLDELADIEPHYNIAPSEDILAVLIDDDGKRVGRFFHWGLIPFWAKDKKIGNRMINARAEGIKDKAAFRHAFKSQRCLVVMSGFFEWKESGEGRKQPYYIHQDNDLLLGVAGIWERWEDEKNRETIRSCSIITTEANDFMQSLHKRMPVILTQGVYDQWLNPDNQKLSELEDLMQPYPDNDLACHKVTLKMNNARFKSEESIEPV